MSLQRGINLRALAEKMGNCSGAEVRGICTEAGEFRGRCGLRAERRLTFALAIGMYALRERRQHVTQEDFELSVAKVSGFVSRLTLRRAHSSYPLLQVLRKAGDANTSSNKLFN